jgi:uncharacterized protein YkwD
MTLARARLHVFLCVAAALAMSAFANGCGGSRGSSSAASGYGVPQQGYPDWNERALLVLTNAVRLAPLDYRSTYAADFSPSLAAVNALAAYPAVGPLRWNLALNESARAHSLDMGENGCFQHDSCDGTAWNVRIASYYSLSATIGENIAAGYPGPQDPRYAMAMWLCDQSGDSCCADGAGCDGHRMNIMLGAYQALGTGYANVATSTYESYWTQDFGGAFDGDAPPLVDGSHIFFPSGQVTFLANYLAPAAPQSLAVVVDGSAIPMAVSLGTAEAGSWAVSSAAGSGCRSYHFEAVDASGASWRFPATGDFSTYGEGNCSMDWAP